MNKAIISFVALLAATTASATSCPTAEATAIMVEELHLPAVAVMAPDPDSLQASATIVTDYTVAIDHSLDDHTPISLYELPPSWTTCSPDWHRLWINTAVYAGAMLGTLGVLECLPEDATSWNRAEIQQTPMFKRWFKNVIKMGPKFDTDSWIFNYIAHPYAGAVYFMSARSSGFNFWQSFAYSAFISTVFWEFGIEAFMERPSIQDIFVTPCIGSLIGEGFYRAKRKLIEQDYRIFGSRVVGGIAAFFMDPVNEMLGLFIDNPARREAARRRGLQSSIVPSNVGGAPGFTFTCTF